ncbi:MAG TPA: SpoIIE family protein phosphatase [Candidatus Sulfotelmatobacter sp.]|nr:SpoIIE family protein phosphatase [Candidatus Sulfotelmatobacter sp.]
MLRRRNAEEYGEARLIQELHPCRHLPANEIIQALLAGVQELGTGARSDDLTLLVGKACS